MMLALYRTLTVLISPLLPYYLSCRARAGKEQRARISERFGHASAPRPPGRLVWIHAASVGEANSVLPLIHALHTRTALLLTTGTITSAEMMQQRLPPGVAHQFVPLDTPAATRRFFRHWRPQLGLMVESELWPNLILSARAGGCKLVLVNGRMSERSYRRWRRAHGFILSLLAAFNKVFAQSEADAARFHALGAPHVEYVGNLKHEAEALGVNAEALHDMEVRLASRPRWLAASVHPGEEGALAGAQRMLQAEQPALLLILAPRHPQKAGALREALERQGLAVSQRSLNEAITEKTNVYLADTMGELGLFYRLAPVAFIGGSLIPHGGQNPLEAARLGCVPCFGPHMFNFADVARGLIAAQAACEAQHSESLVDFVRGMLADEHARAAAAARAAAYATRENGASERLLSYLSHLLSEELPHAA